MEETNSTEKLTELCPEKLKTFEQIRKGLETLKDELRKKKEEFEAQNINLINKIQEESKRLEENKEDIWVMAAQEYHNTGEKKLLGGIGIRIGTMLDYDEEEAFNWALDHKLCLELNVKSFDKLAKDQQLDFVKKSEKVTVTFPKEIKL